MHDRHTLLVLGGARSGKSLYAEERCGAEPGEKIYVATAQAHDDEMQARIQQHQERRGSGWLLLEEPLNWSPHLKAMRRPGAPSWSTVLRFGSAT